MANREVIRILTENGLKVTPQRIAILEVVLSLENHPDAETVIDYIRLNYPHVSIGTVYQTLTTLVKKGIISKVKTQNEHMRYDPVKDNHHHLYCSESERIEDFFDKDLDDILLKYLKNKKIPNFKIEEIKLQLVGKFTDQAESKNNNKN
jgi:Fur family transcriptional regulator, peroxide stress response regulator